MDAESKEIIASLLVTGSRRSITASKGCRRDIPPAGVPHQPSFLRANSLFHPRHHRQQRLSARTQPPVLPHQANHRLCKHDVVHEHTSLEARILATPVDTGATPMQPQRRHGRVHDGSATTQRLPGTFTNLTKLSRQRVRRFGLPMDGELVSVEVEVQFLPRCWSCAVCTVTAHVMIPPTKAHTPAPQGWTPSRLA